MRFVNRKVALVGTGLVGMSYAYALLNQSVCDELTLIDIDQQRAQGEAMDLNHGLAFSGSNMKIYAGGYQDCSDADIVAVCAGVAQKRENPGSICCKGTRKYFSPLSGRSWLPDLRGFS